MRPPIVILGAPRSGTSMTAGIFAQHGVWTGTCRPANSRNPKGFFESEPMREVMLEHFGRLVHEAREAEYKDGMRPIIEEAMRADGYEGGPWLVKLSALYWPMYLDFDPTWVLVRRDVEATIRSGRHSGYNSNPDSVPLHHEVMDRIRDEHGGVGVDTDAVVRGDYSTLERAFDAAGLDLDPAIANDFIDPDLWHEW